MGGEREFKIGTGALKEANLNPPPLLSFPLHAGDSMKLLKTCGNRV